ncbi:MAG: FAD-binding protein [Nocardioidaceae bacterium]|nr:FAD-binding protein [Nocardioidaceae bacterium]
MDALSELADRVGVQKVVTDPDILRSYSRDMAPIPAAGTPAAVLRATSTEDVVAAMTWASSYGVVVVPRGAGTGLSGGANALDGCLVVSLEAMTRVRWIDPVNRVAEVEAGVVNADLGRAVAEHGLFYPPDPGSFEVSTIGGNLATNAGGMRCVKYGVTRASTLGLEVVLADGSVLRTGGRTRKNVAGLDLTSLFVGSEGTLGIITAGIMQLQPAPPRPPVTFAAAFDTLAEAGAAVGAILESGTTPSVLELIDHATINAIEDYRSMGLERDWSALLIGQSDGENAVADVEAMVALCAGAGFVTHTEDPAEGEQLMQARRLAGTATAEAGPSITEDVSVPRGSLVAMIDAIAALSEEFGIRVATVGHAGDGNLHPVLMLDRLDDDALSHALVLAERIAAHAVELGGTVTGEHGVGMLKTGWVRDQLGQTSIDVHRRIKAALDPAGLLNPGRGF